MKLIKGISHRAVRAWGKDPAAMSKTRRWFFDVLWQGKAESLQVPWNQNPLENSRKMALRYFDNALRVWSTFIPTFPSQAQWSRRFLPQARSRAALWSYYTKAHRASLMMKLLCLRYLEIIFPTIPRTGQVAFPCAASSLQCFLKSFRKSSTAKQHASLNMLQAVQSKPLLELITPLRGKWFNNLERQRVWARGFIYTATVFEVCVFGDLLEWE